MATGGGNAGELFGRLVRQLADLPGISTRAAERIAFHLMSRPVVDSEALAQTLLEFRRRMRLCAVCFTHCTGTLCPLCADPHRDHGLICVVEQAADIAAFERSGVYRGSYHVLLGRISPLAGVTPEDLTIDGLLARVAGRLGSDDPFDPGLPADAPIQPPRSSDTAAADAAAEGAEQDAALETQQALNRASAALRDEPPPELAAAAAGELRDTLAPFPWLRQPAREVIVATSATAEGEATARFLQQALQAFPVTVTRIARGLPIGAEVAFAQRSTLATALQNRLPFDDTLGATFRG
ncbi:MAG: recombination mediator RecR [Planctomycetota bacterium]